MVTNPNIPEFPKNSNTLGDPRRELICWQCGSSKNLTTYHTAGGASAVCVACFPKGGE